MGNIHEGIVEINMFSSIENQVVSKLGDVQLSHTESMEKVMEATELMLKHCCAYGGVCEGYKNKLTEVVMKQVHKYKERFRKANARKNNVAVEKIEEGWETKIMKMNRWLVKQLWFDEDFDWLYLPSVGSHVKSEEERNKGEGESRNNNFLNDYIMKNELVDMPFVGGAFIWYDMTEDPLLCRPDRFLLSIDFDLLFPDSIQVSLTRVVSDHKPLMLVTKPSIKSKPYFKFENGCLLHKDFFKNVEKWKEFGGLKKEKEELNKKINVLDQMEETHKLSDEQFEERLKSLLQLKKIKSIEARKWHARAKQNEFRWGDSNTSYFHRIANARKKINTIAKLEIDGMESFEQESIKAEMRSYYEGLFTENNEVSFSFDNLFFPSIAEGEKEELEREFSEAEVYDVVKHFGTNKYLGPDGFSMEFYKICLPIIKTDFMKLMAEFFRFGSWDWRLNCSFISLVPKKEDSCTSKDFRPLSLLGSAYKILSKVPANKLKTMMHKLVPDSQGAFIKGKQILDGVLIAGECVDSWFKDRKPVLVNGSSTKKFKPSKGLRQGDSLSPFLFLLVVEILSKLIDDAVRRDQLKGFQVVEGGIMISHLQFVDDTLLFVDANEEEVRILCSSVWDEVVKRMEVKLAYSKKKFISKAVRLVSIRSCLASLPVYFLSLIPIPANVEKKLNKLMRRFLWGSTDVRRKMSWVSWLKVSKPKSLGGLGVKNLKCTSQALKTKWVGRYATEKKALWRRVVQQKLKNKEEASLPTNDDTAIGRSNWKSILNNTSFVDKEVKFNFNNGKSIRFWLDDWIATGALKARYPSIYKACRNKNASIDDMIENDRLTCQVRRRLNQNEQFEWDMLCNELGPVHGLNEEADSVDIMGGFTVKKCYKFSVQEKEICDFNKFLWKQGVPPKRGEYSRC
ncbi:uncharacterized protein LOC113312608 [Papaver somniferum]|uniref:uncharacterized protein LOC113312608 n=1 Tax=Papaver somniferum TaxID=3469 RepID=UPI000E70173C|nr:uncharacterized protein LOC113312608 [Papaver somniferum]